jgi:hypothetical protein
MEQQQGSQMSDEDNAWLAIMILVAAALTVAVIVVTRVIMSHVVPGSGFGLPIFLGGVVGIAYAVLAYLALRAAAATRARG